MTDQVDRTVLPIRRPLFAGVPKIPPTNLQEHHLEEARKSRTDWPAVSW